MSNHFRNRLFANYLSITNLKDGCDEAVGDSVGCGDGGNDGAVDTVGIMLLDGERDGRMEMDGWALDVTVGLSDGGNGKVGEVVPGAADGCSDASSEIASANKSKIEDGLSGSDAGFDGVNGVSVVCAIEI